VSQKVLIIDDDVQTLKLVGLVLDRNGYNVAVGQSGEQALEKVQMEAPDLLILDVMMPGIDGYEVCRNLRANPDTAGLPILLFTGRAEVEDKVAGFEAGADDYVNKPVHPDELVSRVQALLARSSRSQVTEEAPGPRPVGFLGSKGGVGTTTLAVNVAVALARGPAREQRVLLAELRNGMATAAFQLGFPPSQDGIANIVAQPAASVDADLIGAQLNRHGSGLLVLSGSTRPTGIGAAISPDHAERIVQHLRAVADYLLLDLGVGLDEVNQRLLPRCRHLVVTIERNSMSLALAQDLLEEMNQTLHIPKHNIGLVSISRSRSAASLTKEDIEERLKHDLVGLVPPAPELAFQSMHHNKPMVVMDLDGFAAQQYRTIAEYLTKVL
jgi:pilus assembly protein CpaE